ncbi:MAG: hypothetical protein AB7D36_09630 [Oscillospiraceae bacterium]
MSNTLNWMGNRVVDPSAPRRSSSPAAAAPAVQSAPVPMAVPVQQDSVTLPDTQQGPPPSTEKGFIPYYLTTLIGKNVRAEFIIGNNQYVDKTGIMHEVGINYFVLHDVNSNTYIMCDLYSVKFVTSLA